MATRRKRPAALPRDARWDSEEECWGLGKRDRQRRKRGTWIYYWPDDAALAGRIDYDDEGRRHGVAAWYHPVGDLWQWGSYVHGVLHGKNVWQTASTGESPGKVNFAGLPDGVVRMEMAYVEGVAQKQHFTLYRAEGAFEPIATDTEGRSTELGGQMHKLLPETTLAMTQPAAHTVDGTAIERPGGAEMRIVYQGEAPDGFTVRFRPTYGAAVDRVFDAAELSRAFTLSADYLLSDLARLEEEASLVRALGEERRRSAADRIPALLEGPGLELLLNEWSILDRREGRPRFWLDRDEGLYGSRFPPELQTLLRLHERYELASTYGEFRPFFHEADVFFGGENAAEQHLALAREQYWTIELAAHFCGLYKIGATRAGDWWLAELLAPQSASSRVWFFDHEERTLSLAHHSISELFWVNTFCRGTGFFNEDGWDDEVRQWRARCEDITREHDLDDPARMFERSRWLVSFLAEKELGELGDDLARAAPMARWNAERALVATHVHLALYWLFAHWLLHNEDELEDTLVLTAGHASAFVTSARSLVLRRVSAVDPRVVQLRGEAPERLLGAGMRERRKQVTRKRAGDRKKIIVEARQAGLPAGALMEQHPRDLALHRELLASLAEEDDSELAGWVALFEQVARGEASREEAEALAGGADELFRAPIAALVRRGFGVDRFHPHAGAELIGALGRLGGELSLATLLASRERAVDPGRLAEVARALGAFDDPRVDDWLRWVLTLLLDTQDPPHGADELWAAALEVLDVRIPTDARGYARRAFEGGKATPRAWIVPAAERLAAGAEDEGTLLADWLTEQGKGNPSVAGPVAAALCRAAPKRARSVLPRLWEDRGGATWRDVHWFDLYDLAAVLRGLLPLRPDDPDLQGFAERVLRYRGTRDTELDAILNVLAGAKAARLVEAIPWTLPQLLCGLRQGRDDARTAAVRASARELLETCGVAVPEIVRYDEDEAAQVAGRGTDALLASLARPTAYGKEHLLRFLVDDAGAEVADAIGRAFWEMTERLYQYEDVDSYQEALVGALRRLRPHSEQTLRAVAENQHTSKRIRELAHGALA